MLTMTATVGALILAAMCGSAMSMPGINFLGMDATTPSSAGANQPVFNVGNIKQDSAMSSSLPGLRFDSMSGAGGGGGSPGGLDSQLNLANQGLGGSGFGGNQMMGSGMGMGGGGGLGSQGFGGAGPSLGNRGFGSRGFGRQGNFGGGGGGGFGNMFGGRNSQMPLFWLMMNQMFW